MGMGASADLLKTMTVVGGAADAQQFGGFDASSFLAMRAMNQQQSEQQGSASVHGQQQQHDDYALMQLVRSSQLNPLCWSTQAAAATDPSGLLLQQQQQQQPYQ